MKKKLNIAEIDSLLANKMKENENHCISITEAVDLIKNQGDYRSKRTIRDQVNAWYLQKKQIYISSNDVDFPKDIKRTDRRETYYTFRLTGTDERLKIIKKLIVSDRFADANLAINGPPEYSNYEIKGLFEFIDDNHTTQKYGLYYAIIKQINIYFKNLPIYEYEIIIPKIEKLMNNANVFSSSREIFELYKKHNQLDKELSLNLANKEKATKIRKELGNMSFLILDKETNIKDEINLKREILCLLSNCNKSELIFKYFRADLQILIKYLSEFKNITKQINEKNRTEGVIPYLNERMAIHHRYIEIENAFFKIYSCRELIIFFNDNLTIYNYERLINIDKFLDLTEEISLIFKKVLGKSTDYTLDRN